MKPYFKRVAEQSPTMFWINNPTQPQADLCPGAWRPGLHKQPILHSKDAGPS